MSSTIPSSAGKTSIDKLKEIETLDYAGAPLPVDAPRLVKFVDQGFRYDLLWYPKADAKRLFILFSGDAMRTKNEPPVFQRWSWAPHFPGHCLYISDPALHLHSRLGLAWYAGTRKYDPLPVLRDLLTAICGQLGLPLDSIVSYGSSGGGFAALRLAVVMPEISVICINPQTVITTYEKGNVERFLQVCFAGRDRETALKDFPERMSILASIDKLRGRRIVYIQNTEDHHHYELHFKPFCAALGEPSEPNESEGNFRRLLFAHEGGHTKAETPEVFAKAMEIVSNY